MKNYIVILLIIFTSCNRTTLNDKREIKPDTLKTYLPSVNGTEKQKVFNLDSVRSKIIKDNLKVNHTDTIVYEFSLEEELSAEGNEGKAFYIDNQIKRLVVTFYGEIGRSVYTYVFDQDKINVEERVHEYDVPLSGHIKSTQINPYQISLSGKVIIGSKKDMDTDIYFILKRSIPFALK